MVARSAVVHPKSLRKMDVQGTRAEGRRRTPSDTRVALRDGGGLARVLLGSECKDDDQGDTHTRRPDALSNKADERRVGSCGEHGEGGTRHAETNPAAGEKEVVLMCVCPC